MFKGLKKLIICAGMFALPIVMQAQQFKVVGYLTNWGNFSGDANKVDYAKVTHINIAFLNPEDNTGTLGPTGSLSTVVQTIHNNNVKVLASLGGSTAGTNATLSSYWTSLMQPANRAAFITKIVNFVNTYNLDGIDVDLEDTKIDVNYEGFVTDLGAALKPNGKLMTAAVAQWEAYRFTDKALAQFDFVNIMSYDAYGTWTGRGEHSPYSMAASDLTYFGGRGLSKDKMVVGVPSYGYYWGQTNYSDTYCNIQSKYPRAANQDTIGNISGPGPFYSFNGIPTIKDKTALALSKASGVMMWTLQMDCPTTNSNSLLKAIHDVIVQTVNNIPPTVTLTGPATNSTYDETQTITFTADGSDSDGSINDVSFYILNSNNSITKIGGDNTSPYSFNWVQPSPGTYKIFARALDNVPTGSNSDTITIVVNPSSTEVPYLGSPWPIPGKIEAENYDIGSTLAYYDKDAGNNGGAYRNNNVDVEACSEGGYDVGWIQSGEWINYTVDIAKDSTYDIFARVASPSSSNSFSIDLDGQTFDFNVPNTGGWQKWLYVLVRNVSLTKGEKVMKIKMGTGGFNLNYINFVYYDPNYVAGVFGSSTKTNNVLVYPNPFQNTATIKVDLPSSGQTEVILLDMMGRQIKTISDSYLSQGTQQISFDGSDVPKGFYICKIVQEEKVMTIGITKE